MISVRQVKSSSGSNPSQKATLYALGLGKIGNTSERKDSPQVQGQLKVVGHLVEVSGG